MKTAKGRYDSETRRAIIFVNPKRKNAGELAEEIIKELNSLNIKTDVFSSGQTLGFNSKESYDIAISLGGDGTVLSTARAMSPRGVPIFPVNFGTFGFIAGVPPLEWRDVFGQWQRGKAHLSNRIMLDITVEREGCDVSAGCCLNEVVISSPGKIINLRVSFRDASQNTEILLGLYRSDGLIVSTPTGSTAYSAAAGGPIVDPELDAIILNNICPFTLTHRPMVLPVGEIIVEVDEAQRKGVLLTMDGQVKEKLKFGEKIRVRKAPASCILIASGRHSFFQALQTKLSWAGSVER